MPDNGDIDTKTTSRC